MTWRSAYAGLLPEEFLARLDLSARAERWRQILTDPTGEEPRAATLVAEVGEQVVGFVSVGPALQPPPDGWLYALYVEPAHWGTGLGHRLHEAGLRVLRERGYDAATLWVLRGNMRAIGFYERHGWSRDGREQVDRHLAGVELDEIALSRPLRAPAGRLEAL